MNQKDEFSKWMTSVERALSEEISVVADEPHSHTECDCNEWNCPTCFPDDGTLDIISKDEPEIEFSTGPAKVYPEPTSEFNIEEDDINPPGQEENDHIQQIINMQSMGLSKAGQEYAPDQLAAMQPDELEAIFSQVMGGGAPDASVAPGGQPEVAEADEFEPKRAPLKPQQEPKPFMDPDDPDSLDFGDDMFARQSQPLANYDAPNDGEFNDVEDKPDTPQMRRASAADTRSRTAAITPSEIMRDYMGRINPNAGSDEPELEPRQPENTLVARTAQDVPSVIQNSLRVSGVESPEWHTVDNLPGYQSRNTRGMGRQVFSMFTNTPLEQIQTIANVNNQGPNTDAEIRSVASWLMQNADDLGSVELDHGEAIRGYKPDVKEYSINNVRFHVVRDPMGQYIYAYPDADAKTNRGQGRIQQDREENRMQGRNTPRLRESSGYSLFEELAWDEKIKNAFSELLEAELDEWKKGAAPKREPRTIGKAPGTGHLPGVTARGDRGSSLSRVIGKAPGGKKLIDWLHKRNRLSNEADLTPASFDKRILWKQFKNSPDDFIIISASGGVAAVKPSKAYIDQASAKIKDYNPSGDENLQYQVIAFMDDGTQVDPALLTPPPEEIDPTKKKKNSATSDIRVNDPTVIRSRMGKHAGRDTQQPFNVFNLLSEQIGALRTVWVSGFTGQRGDDEVVDNPHATPKLGSSWGSVERDKMAHRAAGGMSGPVPKKVPFARSPEEIEQRRNVRPIPDDEVDEDLASGMAKKELKKNRDAARYAGKPEQAQSHTIGREAGVNELFQRMAPVFKHVIDKVYGRIHAMAQKYMASGNFDEATKFAQRGKVLQTIKDSLTPGSVPVLSSAVRERFVKGLVEVSGARSEYDQQFLDFLADMTAPQSAYSGKTSHNPTGEKQTMRNVNSVKLMGVASAFEQALKAV